MKQIKISDAKAHLSRHLEYVRRGGRVRILDRDTPVADLVPVELQGSQSEDDQLLAELERRGLARRGKAGSMPAELFRAGPRPRRRASVVDVVIKERRDGR